MLSKSMKYEGWCFLSCSKGAKGNKKERGKMRKRFMPPWLGDAYQLGT